MIASRRTLYRPQRNQPNQFSWTTCDRASRRAGYRKRRMFVSGQSGMILAYFLPLSATVQRGLSLRTRQNGPCLAFRSGERFSLFLKLPRMDMANRDDIKDHNK